MPTDTTVWSEIVAFIDYCRENDNYVEKFNDDGKREPLPKNLVTDYWSKKFAFVQCCYCLYKIHN